jgi:hypothetical protein
MEVSTRDGFWSLWRRHVSTHPTSHPFVFFVFSPLFFPSVFFPSAGVKRTLLLLLSLFDFNFKSVSISVSSAADEISGETVAIKMVTRIFAKATLAKRALRELALLRHFNNHENITGLIDVDGIAETFNEM